MDEPDGELSGRTPQEQVDGVRKRLLGIETRTVEEMVDEIKARTFALERERQEWVRRSRVETEWPPPPTRDYDDD